MLYIFYAIYEIIRDVVVTLTICIIVGVGLYHLSMEYLADKVPLLHNPTIAAAVGAGFGGLVNVPITWLVKGKKKIKNIDE